MARLTTHRSARNSTLVLVQSTVSPSLARITLAAARDDSTPSFRHWRFAVSSARLNHAYQHRTASVTNTAPGPSGQVSDTVRVHQLLASVRKPQ